MKKIMKSICAVGIAAVMATMTGCTGLSEDYRDKLEAASKETASWYSDVQNYGGYVRIDGTMSGERCFRQVVEDSMPNADSYTLQDFKFGVDIQFDGKESKGYEAGTKWAEMSVWAEAANAMTAYTLNSGDIWVDADKVTFVSAAPYSEYAYSVTDKKYAKKLGSLWTLATTNMDITQSKIGTLFTKYMKKAGKGKATLSHVIEGDANTEDDIWELSCDVYAVQLTTAEANAFQKAIGNYMDVFATPLLGDTLKVSDLVKTYTDDEKYQLCLYVSKGVPVGISQISIDANGKKSVTTVEMWTTGNNLYAGITSDSINAEFVGTKQKSGKYNGTLTTNSGCTIITVKDFDYEKFITTGELYGTMSTNEYENAQRVDAGDRMYYTMLAKQYPEKAESYMKMAQNANTAKTIAAEYKKQGIDVNTLETGITFKGAYMITLFQKDKKGNVYNVSISRSCAKPKDWTKPFSMSPPNRSSTPNAQDCTMSGFEEQLDKAEATVIERLTSLIATPKK